MLAAPSHSHFAVRRFGENPEKIFSVRRWRLDATSIKLSLMSGPPPIPLQLRLLRGNPSKRPIRKEPQPARAPQCPDPPTFLDGYAADEWWRVAPELHRLGLLTTLDVAPLAAYCAAYDHWRTASEVLARMRDGDEKTHGLIVKTVEGNARANPLVKMAADAAGTMIAVAGHFGMTPVARSRLAGIGAQPGPSKFAGLLAGDD
jgi:P27 family predicted phage terminase small subunit